NPTLTSLSALYDPVHLTVAATLPPRRSSDLTVTPNDTFVDGAAASDSATVANSAPTATVGLNTHAPFTNDTLTATATKSDADGDPVTLTFVWKVGTVTKRTFSSDTALTDTFDSSEERRVGKGHTATRT